MPLDVVTEIVIRRSVSDVAAFAADPTNAPDWYANIKEARMETPGPLARGARIAFVAKFLGRRLEYTYEVKEYVPGSRLVMATTEGPFAMETTYTWQPASGGGTRMTLRNRGEAKGFSRLLAPFMARAVRRENRKDLERLKRLLEGARSATAP
ncbi:MAG: SRPBCC family protein [Methanobacteriota archaeon]